MKYLITFLILVVFISNAAGQGKGKPKIAVPDSSAEQILGKPDPRKVPAKKLIEVVDEVLKQEQHKRESSLGYEMDGLVIDESLTKVGRDYYDIFYTNWEAPPQINNYNIVIKERPLRGRGFQIIILVNDIEISEENLQPQYDMLEAAALNAVENTKNYLLNYENLKEQLNNDDQKGTGLF